MPGRLIGIEGLDWKKFLNASARVRVMNDAQASLLGEVRQGAAEGKDDVVLLTIGTGVGGAAICGGRLLRRHIGRAGHFGHISLAPFGKPDVCQPPGSLEDAIGDCTVEKRSGGRFTRTKELVDAHLAGDLKARSIWLRSVRYLAAGIVSLVGATFWDSSNVELFFLLAASPTPGMPFSSLSTTTSTKWSGVRPTIVSTSASPPLENGPAPSAPSTTAWRMVKGKSALLLCLFQTSLNSCSAHLHETHPRLP